MKTSIQLNPGCRPATDQEIAIHVREWQETKRDRDRRVKATKERSEFQRNFNRVRINGD